MRHFNPRAREGRDQVYNVCYKCAENFNPRAREGRDMSETVVIQYIRPFQSTRP